MSALRRTFLLTSGAAAIVLAQGSGASGEIRKAEQAWIAALGKNDIAGVGQFLADDIVYTHSTGLVENKAKYLAKLKTGEQRYSNMTYSDEKLRIYGDTGVFTAQVRMEGSTKGVPFDNRLRIIHVWARQGGNWKLVAHQTTRLP